MLDVNDWCKKVMPEVIKGQELYPWEKKIEKGFWRGKLTGMDLDHFPIGVVETYPRPEYIKRDILADPSKWPRVYLSYLSSHHPDYLDAKMTDDFPLQS